MKSRVTLTEGMSFDGELDGHTIVIDADESVGGKDKGPRPKGLVLTALAGCTAMDVISILNEHPKVLTKIPVTYHLKGGAVTQEKAEKAANLSEERYCGVSAMLREAAEMEMKVIVEN